MLANKSLSPSSSSVLSSPSENLRSKSKKKDESLRKYSQKVLSKKEVATPKKRADVVDPNSVMSLKPAAASVILESSNVMQAVHIMAAKRTDAVLVVDQGGELVGILTDKDIAYRVVAEGLDARSTIISSVMTRNPIHLLATGHRNDALTIMVEKKFRHLPVLSKVYTEDGSVETCTVVGILDITKCVFDRLDELSSKAQKEDALLQAFGTINENYGAELLGSVSSQIQGCPAVGSVLAKVSESPDYLVPEVTLRVNVRETACLMKELHVTAVLVVGSAEGEDVAGIFTTKDIILRVLAAQLEPSNTSIVRVMTSHPDFVTPDTSILESLQKLKAGHYLHLPVVNEQGPVGLVDVSTLTISMLDYLMGKEDNKRDLKGVLDLFWQTPGDHSELESEMSEPPSFHIRSDTMSPKRTMPQVSVKLRDVGSGTNYRFTLTSNNFSDLLALISEKTGHAIRYKSMHLLSMNNLPMSIKFKDDESDFVIISNDRDLREALAIKNTKLELYLEETKGGSNLMYWMTGLAVICIASFAVFKDNLDAYTPIILDLINQCTMVSIDTEFSGLGDSKMTRQPNIQDRYTALKSTVEEHTLLALGLSIFGKGTVDNFHILMYSKSDFKISSSSIEFLAKNNFDFNFLFSHGISLDRHDRNPLLLKIWQSLFNRRIVVHNGWLDLMYLYSFLYSDLPNELGTFIADLYDMFNLGIFDTKYIADYEYREKASFLAYLFGKWERLCIDDPLDLKIQDEIPVLVERSVIVNSPQDLKYCERYAAHGFCPNNACSKSHDLDVILERLENLPRLKKRRVVESRTTEPRSAILTQIEHSACYDSYMTGYIFCNQIKKNDVINSSKNKLYLIGKSRPLLIEKSRFSNLSKGHVKLK